jgi:hypothetical protein
MSDLLVDNQIYHHNLARGCCYCEDSNFGEPYGDEEIHCYDGARGGRPYRHPSFCWYCRKKENTGGPKLLQCARCHEAKYCDKRCQEAHWGSHKHSCCYDLIPIN